MEEKITKRKRFNPIKNPQIINYITEQVILAQKKIDKLEKEVDLILKKESKND